MVEVVPEKLVGLFSIPLLVSWSLSFLLKAHWMYRKKTKKPYDWLFEVPE
jgi:hypothetical protein